MRAGLGITNTRANRRYRPVPGPAGRLPWLSAAREQLESRREPLSPVESVAAGGLFVAYRYFEIPGNRQWNPYQSSNCHCLHSVDPPPPIGGRMSYSYLLSRAQFAQVADCTLYEYKCCFR